MWLDGQCGDRYGKPYLESAVEQQKEILDSIAYRKNADKTSALLPGVDFFALLREMTADGFFTSQIGIKYLGYAGILICSTSTGVHRSGNLKSSCQFPVLSFNSPRMDLPVTSFAA